MTKTTADSVILTTGLDLGDYTTHLCSLDPERRVIERAELRTKPASFKRYFEGKPSQHVVLEAGSQSLWVSHLLKELGHEVMVVDPWRTKLITESDRKTDRQDAETLARLALGVPELLGCAQHRTLATQSDVAILRSRDLLVRMRTMEVAHCRSQLKSFGITVPSCSAGCFYQRVGEHLPEHLAPALVPMLRILENIEQQIREFDKTLEKVAERYPATQQLRQVRGVGPLTSLAFVLTIADPKRFLRSRSVGPWLGLVPKRRASGQSDPQLRISKRGDGYLRRLLVTSGQYILGPFGTDSDLRRYGEDLCRRGGRNAKKRAVVAVARKLAVLLHRLWVSGATYEPLRNSSKREAAALPPNESAASKSEAAA